MGLTKPDQGWVWVVASSVFGAHWISGYFYNAIGLIQIIMLEKFDTKPFYSSWITAVFIAFTTLIVYALLCRMMVVITMAGPIASIMINRNSCRTTMITGSLMLTTGLILTAFVGTIWWTFLTFGLLAGTGLGLCYNTGLIVLGLNFEKKCNLTCGIASSGAGIGPFVLTPVYQMVYDNYSYTGFFLLLSGLTLQNSVFGATFRVSEIEAKMRLLNANRKHGCKHSFKAYLEIIKNRSMTFVCLSYFLINISLFIVYVHFPAYCLHTHSTKMEISLFLSLAGICGSIVRILFGMANNTNNIEELIMLFGVYSLLGVLTATFPIFSYSFYAKIIYGCIFGSYSGCCWTLLNIVMIQTLGREKLAHGIGYLMIYAGTGSFLGPPLGAFIIDSGGTYRDSFITAGVLFICGAFCALCSILFRDKDIENAYGVDDYEYDVKLEMEDEMLKIKFRDASS